MTAVLPVDLIPTQIPLLEEGLLPDVDASWVRLPRTSIVTSAFEASATPFLAAISVEHANWDNLIDLSMPCSLFATSYVTLTVTTTADSVTGSAVMELSILGHLLAPRLVPADMLGLVRRLLRHPGLCAPVPSRLRVIEEMAVGFDVAEEAEAWTQLPPPPRSVARDAIHAGSDQHAGLRAVDNLRRWLNLTVAGIAHLADLSESTIYWWAEHPASVPRPAKIDRLLGLEALIAGLVEELGMAAAARWFRRGNPGPLTRLREDPSSFVDVEEAVYGFLMERARARLNAASPQRVVTEQQYDRDVERLAAEEQEVSDPIATHIVDPSELEPDERA